MRPVRYWLAVGPPDNWRTAFQQANIWGLRLGRLQEVFWDLLNEQDDLIFYVGRPISGVIGFGTIKTKFKDFNNPLWADEIKARKVLYPLRLEFDPEVSFPPDSWPQARLVINSLKPLVRGGFQPLQVELAQPIIQQLLPGWNPTAVELPPPPAGPQPGGIALSHDEVKAMLVEIGKIQKFLAEPEFVMDTGRLDVVWRRVEKSVPTYVFEVQVGGDIYHALGKLKHAYDLWNSHIFFVAHPNEWPKFDQLLSGTFHEIRHRVRFIPLDKIRELYERKRAFKQLESALGIPT